MKKFPLSIELLAIDCLGNEFFLSKGRCYVSPASSPAKFFLLDSSVNPDELRKLDASDIYFPPALLPAE